MELVLNLAWALLASTMVCLWLRIAPREGRSRRTQIAALAMLLFVLFPVISVTDDLQAALNPAETDSCLRRDHVCPRPHHLLAAIAGLPLPAFSGLDFGLQREVKPAYRAAPTVRNPAFGSIQNRPPPAA